MIPKENECVCICTQESRLTALETKVENKRENIHEIHEDYYHLRDKLESISVNVIEVTTIIREMQKNRDVTDQRVEILQLQFKEMNGSIKTLKWLFGLGLPIFTTILSVVINQLI